MIGPGPPKHRCVFVFRVCDGFFNQHMRIISVTPKVGMYVDAFWKTQLWQHPSLEEIQIHVGPDDNNKQEKK